MSTKISPSKDGNDGGDSMVQQQQQQQQHKPSDKHNKHQHQQQTSSAASAPVVVTSTNSNTTVATTTATTVTATAPAAPSNTNNGNGNGNGSKHEARAPTNPNLTQPQVSARFKACIRDVSLLLKNHRDEAMCDYFIALVDDGVKAIKGAKADIRLMNAGGGGNSNTEAATSTATANSSNINNANAVGRMNSHNVARTNTNVPSNNNNNNKQHHKDPHESNHHHQNNNNNSSTITTSPQKSQVQGNQQATSSTVKPAFSYAAALLGSNQQQPQPKSSPLKQQPPADDPDDEDDDSNEHRAGPATSARVNTSTPPPLPRFNNGEGGSSTAAASNGNSPQAGGGTSATALALADAELSTQRGEERRAEAEGRRKMLASERHRKFEEQAERIALVKARREQALERSAAETREKADRHQKAREVANIRKKEHLGANPVAAPNTASTPGVSTLSTSNMEQHDNDNNNNNILESPATANNNNNNNNTNTINNNNNNNNTNNSAATSPSVSTPALPSTVSAWTEDVHQTSNNNNKKNATATAAADDKTPGKPNNAKNAAKEEIAASNTKDAGSKQTNNNNNNNTFKTTSTINNNKDSTSPSTKEAISAAIPSSSSTASSSAEDHYISRLTTVVQRHGRVFLENFAKENEGTPISTKCRFNLILEKFHREKIIGGASAGGGVSTTSVASFSGVGGAVTTINKQTAGELSRALAKQAATEPQDQLDHASLRLHNPNIFEVLSASISEMRKNALRGGGGNNNTSGSSTNNNSNSGMEASLQKAPFDLLLRLITHPKEGHRHLAFLCRSGLFVPVVTCVLQDMKKLNYNNNNMSATSLTLLRDALSIVHLCIHFFIVEDSHAPSSHPFRVILGEFLNMLEPEKIIAGLCENPHQLDNNNNNSDSSSLGLEILQYTLLLFQLRLRATAAVMKDDETARTMKLLLTSTANLLGFYRGSNNNNNNTNTQKKDISHVGTLVVFTLLRLMNDLARKNLSLLHKTLVDPACRQLAFQMLSRLYSYINDHSDELEDIHNPTSSDVKALCFDPGALSPTFLDAVDFGLTFINCQRPADSSNTSGSTPAPGAATSGREVAAAADGSSESRLRSALHEALLFTGYITLNNPSIQEIFHYSNTSHATPSSSSSTHSSSSNNNEASTSLLLQMLESCPISYFGVGKHILLPTLICVCYKNRRNLSVLSQEVPIDQISEFLTEEISARPVAKKKMIQQQQKLQQQQQQQQQTSNATADNNAKATPPLAPQQQPSPSNKLPQHWADFMDGTGDEDDDDDLLDEQQQQQMLSNTSFDCAKSTASSSTATTTTTTNNTTTESALAAERKQKLTQSIATTNNRFSLLHHFRIDKRFPLSLWLEAVNEYERFQQEGSP